MWRAPVFREKELCQHPNYPGFRLASEGPGAGRRWQPRHNVSQRSGRRKRPLLPRAAGMCLSRPRAKDRPIRNAEFGTLPSYPLCEVHRKRSRGGPASLNLAWIPPAHHLLRNPPQPDGTSTLCLSLPADGRAAPRGDLLHM